MVHFGVPDVHVFLSTASLALKWKDRVFLSAPGRWGDSDLWVLGSHARTFPGCHRVCLRCFVPGTVHVQEEVDQCIKLTCITTGHAILHQMEKILSRTSQLLLSGLNLISCSQEMTRQDRWNSGLRGIMLAQLSSRGVPSVNSFLQPVHVGDLGWLEKHWSFVLCFSCR